MRESFAASERVGPTPRGWPDSSEWVADFRRNGWPDCLGISGRFGSDYAVTACDTSTACAFASL